MKHFVYGVEVESKNGSNTYFDYSLINEWINKPRSKTHSVSGKIFDHNANHGLPEIIGEWFDLSKIYIEGYKAGDCTVKSPKLEWRHFTRVQKFNETQHPKTKVRVVTVLAWTKNNYIAPVLLICKYK